MYAGIIGETTRIRPDRVLQHADADLLVADDAEVLRLVQLARVGVDRLEDLGVLVVRHRLGSIDRPVEQRDHVELLADEVHVGGRIETCLADRREQLVLVAEAPVADVLSGEVRRRRDSCIGEAHLQGSGALVDLGDVGDVGTGFAAGERLGHPREREVDVAVRELRLRHDLDAALDDADVEAHVVVEALVLGGVVAGELGLGEPLQLQADRLWRLAVAG